MTSGSSPTSDPKIDLSKATPAVKGIRASQAGANLSEHRKRVLQNFVTLHTYAALTQASIPPSAIFQLHPPIAFSNGYPPASIIQPASAPQIAHALSHAPLPLPAPSITPLPLPGPPSKPDAEPAENPHSSAVEPESVQRLIPIHVKTRKEVLERWHHGKSGVCGPLKRMTIQKKNSRRDYNLWHNRKVIAVAHAKLGDEKHCREVATDEQGSPRKLQDNVNICSKLLRKLKE